MARRNKRFGRLNSDGTIEYARLFVQTSTGIRLNPTDEDYVRAGFKFVRDNPPKSKWGHFVQQDGIDATDSEITVKYKYVEVPQPPPPEYGLWTKFKMWLLKYRIGGYLYQFKLRMLWLKKKLI